jgi:hypothetical protein
MSRIRAIDKTWPGSIRRLATMTEAGAAAPAKELVGLADTTDLYATATGLIERSAAAYVSGMPDGARDDGFFGPASVTWRMSADLASPVAGLRSLLMQALHPLAMAGVDQHSGWRITLRMRGARRP